ncbi:MAG: glycosyltransferase family 4 protein [Candidatus Bathyarchaeia archaeon]
MVLVIMNIGIVMYQTSFTKGQELVAQGMACELARQGHKAFLITGPFHDNKLVDEFNEIKQSVKGYLLFKENEFKVPLVRVDGYLSSWPPRRIMFRDFVSVLRNLVESLKLDVIISHSTLWNGPEEIAKFMTWKRMLMDQGLGGREVAYAHMSHYQPPDPVRYDIFERTYRVAWNTMVFPHIFEAAKLILCTTPIEEEQMIDMGARREQCHLYPGGINEEPFQRHWSDNPSGFLEKHSIPNDARIVTYLGTVEERKNPLAVVRVAKMLRGLKDVHFVIAGRPSTQDKSVRIEGKGLRNCTIVGEVSEEDKVMLIKSSYVNILLSHMEALGLTQLEFMYGGVPIITSAVGGQKWLVRDRVDGIHVKGPNDLEGAAEAIKTLINDPELRDRLGANAKSRASEFTLSKITSELSYRLRSLVTSR